MKVTIEGGFDLYGFVLLGGCIHSQPLRVCFEQQVVREFHSIPSRGRFQHRRCFGQFALDLAMKVLTTLMMTRMVV